MQELFTTHFLEVLKNKYAEFTGRETRRNYWMYVLAVFLINFALYILMSIFKNVGFLYVLFSIINYAFSLAILIPGIAISVRRLHDIGKDWQWIFIILIPFAGAIWFIVLMAQEAQKEDNQFGPYVA